MSGMELVGFLLCSFSLRMRQFLRDLEDIGENKWPKTINNRSCHMFVGGGGGMLRRWFEKEHGVVLLE